MPKAIIFDWDDTLAHTRDSVVESMEYVLTKYGKEPWDITKIKYRDTKKSLKDNFPNFFDQLANDAYQDYLNYYIKFGYNKVTPVDYAENFLEICNQKKIELYIISNKEKSLLLKEVSFCFPYIHFKNILGNGDALRNKPFADPVFKALDKVSYTINEDNVWLIGDTKQDTECAYNAGIQAILLGKGKFMDEEYLNAKIKSPNPLWIFDDFSQMISFMIRDKKAISKSGCFHSRF